MNQLEAAAIHEAGHAFMAWVQGFSLRTVTVNDDGHQGKTNAGTPFYCQATMGEDHQVLEKLHAKTCYQLAGMVAEEMGGFEIWTGQYLESAEMLQYLASFRTEPKIKSMIDAAAEIQGKVDLPILERGRLFYESMRVEIQDMLSDTRSWSCIKAVASALEARGTLAGREVAVIFELTMGGRPPGALPLDRHMIHERDQTKSVLAAVEEVSAIMGLVEDTISKTWPDGPVEEITVEKLRAVYLQALLQTQDIRRRYLEQLSQQASG